jgi:hypothetical protein
MSHRVHRLAAALAVGCFAVSGCAAPRGPLDYGNGGGEVCVPATTEQPMLIGDSFRTGDSAIHIDSAELADPVGMELEGVWLTTPEGAIGAMPFPPPSDLHWEDAVDAIGATIPPHTEQTFAFLVRPTGTEKATASGLALTYTMGPFTYRNVGNISVVLEDPCF